MGSCLLIRRRTLVDVRGLDADSLFFTEELAISGALCVRSATSWGGAGPVPIDFAAIWERNGGDARPRAKTAE